MQPNNMTSATCTIHTISAPQLSQSEKYKLLTAKNKAIILARIVQLKADQLGCQ